MIAKFDLCQVSPNLLHEQQELCGRLMVFRIVDCIKAVLTAIHKSSKKTNGFPFHALCSGKKLDMSVCFPIYFQAKKQRIKKLGTSYFNPPMDNIFNQTHLIIVRGTNKYDWPFSRNMESASWSYFSEEDLGYCPPEKHGGIVGDCVP